ncbi:hypothetical protein A946_11145 [Methylacidiphilum kamchatkense Kam1]|uniref:Uncharacterized protein n=1 Tax=Methylacidiphilum kamchatkense Kam1 TaxID=1202785 RepID=A0A0C1RSB8_9BACT|nr:hypothetical protein A946_11145 [Methylacidiphilum kamchatkense Kam1]QDQ41505.1 hypothetical protein kam1_250 [Methylacidiphilum kamchatkense Kam1]
MSSSACSGSSGYWVLSTLSLMEGTNSSILKKALGTSLVNLPRVYGKIRKKWRSKQFSGHKFPGFLQLSGNKPVHHYLQRLDVLFLTNNPYFLDSRRLVPLQVNVYFSYILILNQLTVYQRPFHPVLVLPQFFLLSSCFFS